MCFLVKIT